MEEKQSIKELVKIELKDCRFHADCMALKVKEYREKDKWLNIFLALTSSGGIASWAIWKELGWLWGAIIALSQLVNALKPLFQFSKHVHSLNMRCYKQETLFLELDNLWFSLLDGVIGEDTAKTRLMYLKQRLRENMFFDDDDSFEFSEDVQNKARLMTTDTLKVKYNITD